jgi:nitrile hydratase beta subunit
MNSLHDVGGMDGFGPVSVEEDEPVFHADWEGRVRALHTLVRNRGLYNGHESRYAIERIDPVYALGASYYQKWLFRLETFLLDKGVLSREELDAKTSELSLGRSQKPNLNAYRRMVEPIHSSQRKRLVDCARSSPQNSPMYKSGDRVRTRLESPVGHTRIPRYVRGKEGVVERITGHFVLPDRKAMENQDAWLPVYLVRFNARDLWGADASVNDKLYIELWESYIEGRAEHERAS